VPRQPGSALKPFTYALAFEEGRDPSTLLADVPSHFPTAEPGVLYSPRNYDGRYRGPLLARKALAGSENVPAVALASELGVPKLLRFLARAGFSTFDRSASYYGLGVTLGNAEVRLDELTSAYASFARGGVYRAPRFLVDDRSTPPRSASTPSTLVSERTAFFITDILSDDDARAWVFGRGGNLEFPFPVAVKTGTSQAYHDNWTVGYTRDVTVGVWVGNFDRTPLHDSSGVTGAGPLFHAIMLAAARRSGDAATRAAADPIVARPGDVEEATICALSGERANAWCPAKVREWVPAGADAVPCSWHHQSDDGVLTIWPPAFRAWKGDSPPSAEKGDSPPSAPLLITSPPSGALYSIDPTLRPEYQAVPLRATTARPTVVTWAVDGRVVGEASSERALTWPLAVGRHRVTARDRAGREAAAEITVR
jgi:penicillin-binding protein 1C